MATTAPTIDPQAVDFTNLDPQVVSLAKAIRTTESNTNYNAVGDNGNSHGAYQFNQGNFQHWATQFGLDPNDFSPVNQDKVAYAKMKAWKDEGYHAGEIAAMWNGANMENGRPVANNPDYITKVQKNLQPSDIKANPDTAGGAYSPNPTYATPVPTGQTITAPTPSIGQQAGNAVNATAGALGIQKAGQGMATAAREFTGGGNEEGDAQGAALQQLSAIMAKYPVGSSQRKAAIAKYQQLYQGGVPTEAEIDPGTALSNKEVLGSFGNVGLLALAGGELKGAGIAADAGKVGQVLNKAVDVAKPVLEGGGMLGKILRGAAQGYGFDVASAANANKDNIFKPGLGTAVGGVLPGLLKVGGMALKGTTSLLSGASQQAIQRAIDNPDAVGAAVKQFANNPGSEQSLISTAKDALNSFLQDRNKQFGDSLSSMVASSPIDKQTVLDSFAKQVANFGGKITENGLEFGDTALTSTEQKSISDVYDIVKSWKDVTPQGMDTLRQRIGKEMSNFRFANNGQDNVVLSGIKNDLTNLMKSKIPGYDKMLSDYGTQTQAAKDLAGELSLKGNAKPTTQLNQIMKIFKKDPSVTANLVKVMGQDGANKFLDDVSGSILSKWLPQGRFASGLDAALQIGGGALTTLTHSPYAMGAEAATAAASSPRLVGLAARTAGRAIQSGAGGLLRGLATQQASRIHP